MNYRYSNRKTLVNFLLLITLALTFVACREGSHTVSKPGSPDISHVSSGNNSSANDYQLLQPPGNPRAKYEIHFINVGQGDAILIITPEKKMLIDGGPIDGGLFHYLQKNNINEIDIVVATHPHADHIGGLIEVLDKVSVKRVTDPGMVHTTRTYRNYLSIIDNKDIPYTIARKGDRIELGKKAWALILSPADIEGTSIHDASVVMLVTLDKMRLLLTGDIERNTESWLMKEPQSIKADILKVPHHGSETSLHDEFIEAVNPSLAIITCGEYNSYGNPHRKTILSLQKREVRTYRTDINGHIIVLSNGKTYKTWSEKDSTILSLTIDLNHSTEEELRKIIHIGAERAAQIIKMRPLTSIDDLLKVDGIGVSRLEEIKRQGVAVVK